MRRSNVRKSKNHQGFSLIETLIIVVIIGILAAIAIPSFASSFDRFKLNQAVVEVRGVLQEAQRQAIRNSKPCEVELNLSDKQVTANCQITGDRQISNIIDMATNISLITGGMGNKIKIKFGILGTAEFSVVSSINPPPPSDSSGKIVFYVSHSSLQDKKCLAISNTLGLTRAGAYAGNYTNANEITDSGICTAS
jgi:prepilin-type N-terminal cleavage/methylation domain-containing protein